LQFIIVGRIDDWRLPELNEFQTLKMAAESCIDEINTLFSPHGNVYWTATDPPAGFPGSVAYAADGTTFYRTNKYFVRAVR